MDTFEYLTVLISVIVGLAVVHVLQGVGQILTRPGPRKLYWIHSLWVVQSLAQLFNFWWFELGYRPVTEWSSPLFVFILVYAIALYLQCVVIVPDAPVVDYEAYFISKRSWFFGIVIAIVLLDALDTLLKPEGVVPAAASGTLAVVTRTALEASLLGFGIYTQRRWYHGALAVLSLLYQLTSLFLRSQPAG